MRRERSRKGRNERGKGRGVVEMMSEDREKCKRCFGHSFECRKKTGKKPNSYLYFFAKRFRLASARHDHGTSTDPPAEERRLRARLNNIHIHQSDRRQPTRNKRTMRGQPFTKTQHTHAHTHMRKSAYSCPTRVSANPCPLWLNVFFHR